MDIHCPATISELETPAFLVDLDKVKSNCDEMRHRCETLLGVKLRAHLKTHKTLEAAILMTGGTKRCVCVSTLKEAEFFADGGFDDIVYAAPLIAAKVPRCKVLAEKLQAFHVMVDSLHGIEALAENPLKDGQNWSVLLKIDIGSKRAGVLWNSDQAVDLAKTIATSGTMVFYGLYGYCGGLAYECHSADELKSTSDLAAARLLECKNKINGIGLLFETCGIGCTPTASFPGEKISQLTELHPGNYVFYDVEQTLIGSVSLDRVACKVATRVTGHYPDKNTILVDCGFMALSHDGKGLIPPGSTCLVEGHPELMLTEISQEVGTLEPVSGKIDYSQFPLGKMLFFYPYHSSATAAMFPFYYVYRDDKIVDTWTPTRGW
ncbi:D-serine dehydratase-like [Tubulanus polymorphus]|uniref:D-serine dehydratase-like n=1 Tax=Tubulanus polymorphus TaxID=672921 RepID=UPI003DA5C626